MKFSTIHPRLPGDGGGGGGMGRRRGAAWGTIYTTTHKVHLGVCCERFDFQQYTDITSTHVGGCLGIPNSLIYL